MDNWMEELGEHLVFISTLPPEVVEREGLELGKQLTDMASLLLRAYHDYVRGCTSLAEMLSPNDKANLGIYFEASLIAIKADIERDIQEDIDIMEAVDNEINIMQEIEKIDEIDQLGDN